MRGSLDPIGCEVNLSCGTLVPELVSFSVFYFIFSYFFSPA
jgi:hypothetical protein